MRRAVGTGGPEEWPCGAPFSSEEGGPFSDIENSSDEGSPFSDVEDDGAAGWDFEAVGQQQPEEPEPEPESALMSKPDSTERLLRERIANDMWTRAERAENNQQTATTPANSAVAGGLRLVASMLVPPVEFDLRQLPAINWKIDEVPRFSQEALADLDPSTRYGKESLVFHWRLLI
jgi:hypothetical protein